MSNFETERDVLHLIFRSLSVSKNVKIHGHFSFIFVCFIFVKL